MGFPFWQLLADVRFLLAWGAPRAGGEAEDAHPTVVPNDWRVVPATFPLVLLLSIDIPALAQAQLGGSLYEFCATLRAEADLRYCFLLSVRYLGETFEKSRPWSPDPQESLVPPGVPQGHRGPPCACYPGTPEGGDRKARARLVTEGVQAFWSNA